MSDAARFPLHRPELLEALVRGEQRVITLMRASSVTVPADSAVVEANTDHPFVYRLQRGWAARARLLPDGRHQFIFLILPGDLFAVKSMFVSRQVDAVIAITDLLAERVDYRTLYVAYAADPDVATRCIWQVIEEERGLHNWVVGLGQGTAEERLARLIIDLRGRLVLSQTISPDSLSFDMPLTQVQLADHLGITAVHVSRVLREFRVREIVTVSDGRVIIADLNALAKRASALLDTYERMNPSYVGTRNPEQL